MLLVPKKDMAREDFMDVPIMDVILPSYEMIEVASEAYLEKEVTVSVVGPVHHVELMKALQNATPGSPPDQPVETRIVLYLSPIWP